MVKGVTSSLDVCQFKSQLKLLSKHQKKRKKKKISSFFFIYWLNAEMHCLYIFSHFLSFIFSFFLYFSFLISHLLFFFHPFHLFSLLLFLLLSHFSLSLFFLFMFLLHLLFNSDIDNTAGCTFIFLLKTLFSMFFQEYCDEKV